MNITGLAAACTRGDLSDGLISLRRTIFAGIAEFERVLSISAPAPAAKRLGRGRALRPAPKLTAEQVVVARRLIEEGTAVRETARILNVHVATLYRALATAAPGDMTGRLRRARG
jgi:DNA invertase Pin-like site-specific DNA recombinase